MGAEMKTIAFCLLGSVLACSSSCASRHGGEAAGAAGVATGGRDQASAGNPSASGGVNEVAGSQASGNAGARASAGSPSAAAGSPPGGGGASTADGSIKFHDDFQGAWPGDWTLLNRPGDGGNQEVGCYKPGNATLDAGMLQIKTQADSSCSGFSVTSAMVQWTSFSFTYGTIEVRAKLAGGNGPWPAIWLLGADCQQSNVSTPDNTGKCSWPNPGSDEIDIAEMLGSGRTSVNQQVHAATGNPGCSSDLTDASKNFHTYRLVWKKDSLVWSVDGKDTCTIKESVPTRPMFLIINTAVGGIGGGNVDKGTLPQTSYIDEVTVWQ
jgi:beta-glucanase (GH16 family)